MTSLSDVNNYSRLQLLIREGIESAKGSTEEAFTKAGQFVSEIFLYNSALLMAFTPPGGDSACDLVKYTGAASTEIKSIIQMRKGDQQNKLHAWLMQLLNNEIQPENSLAKSKGSNETPDSLSSLRSMISSYFQDGEDTEENLSESWTEKARRREVKNPRSVGGTVALKTKVVIYVLGKYYKSTDLFQWHHFFHQDSHFVDVFGLLKNRQQKGNLARDHKRSTWGT
jgi:hypothetical protein